LTRLRLVLVLVFALLPLVASRVSTLRASHARSYDASALPDRLGGHRLRAEQPLEADVITMLAPESYSMRVYADDAGSVVWIYVALYSGTGTSGAHDPTVCYPAQGWDAAAPEERTLSLPSGETLTAKVLAASQAGREELVLYWFQPAERWPAPASPEHLLRIVDRFEGNPQYAFVRLSTGLGRRGDTTRADAEARLARIAVEAAPWIRKAVAGTGS
jgi:EpsI family protein